MNKVTVIGTGHWGRNLARNFNSLGALDGLCDSDSTALAAQAALYDDVKTWSDPEQVFADPDITAVVIATPAATHGALVRQALKAEKHVFVEKPLCLDLREAAGLQQLANSDNLTLMVGHLLLYHPAYRALKSCIQSGQIGEIRYIYSNRASLGKIRQEENALWSFAPHDISMILDLTGMLPRRVVCNGGTYLYSSVADTSLSHMTFSEGLQAHIFVSWLHPFKDHRMVVIGSDGMAVFNDGEPGSEKLLVYEHEIGWSGAIPNVNRAEGVPIPYSPEEPLRLECFHFLECIESGATPISNVEEAIGVLTVLDACQRSLSSGDPVEL